jgi:hypothetical protein
LLVTPDQQFFVGHLTERAVGPVRWSPSAARHGPGLASGWCTPHFLLPTEGGHQDAGPAARRERRSARGAASLAVRAIGAARGCAGTIIVRMDSACYNAAVIGAIRSHGARFSVTAPANSSVRTAIAAIGEDARTPVRYPQAVWDAQLGCWISDAEVAEARYTAFASKKNQAVTARLIVRRVRDQNKKAAAGQGELFPAWRHHAVFTDSPFELAEGQHRGHARPGPRPSAAT